MHVFVFVVYLFISPLKKSFILPIDLKFCFIKWNEHIHFVCNIFWSCFIEIFCFGFTWLFSNTLEVPTRCHFFQNLIWTWSQNPIAIENTTCQCRTAFPHDDLTSYLWGLSIFGAKDKFTVRKTTRETLVQIKNIKFSKFLIFLLCLHLSPDSVSRAGYISNR